MNFNKNHQSPAIYFLLSCCTDKTFPVDYMLLDTNLNILE